MKNPETYWKSKKSIDLQKTNNVRMRCISSVQVLISELVHKYEMHLICTGVNMYFKMWKIKNFQLIRTQHCDYCPCWNKSTTSWRPAVNSCEGILDADPFFYPVRQGRSRQTEVSNWLHTTGDSDTPSAAQGNTREFTYQAVPLAASKPLCILHPVGMHSPANLYALYCMHASA